MKEEIQNPSNPRKPPRGFASAIAAVLAALALSFAISAVLAYGSIQQAGEVAIEARKAFEVQRDAVPFFDASVNDALLDSAYQKCGCSSNNASGVNATISTLVRQYLNNASSLLSTAVVYTNYSNINVPSFSVSSCNATLSGTFSYTVSSNSSNARVNYTVSTAKGLGIQKNSSAVSINLTNSSVLVANVTVTC